MTLLLCAVVNMQAEDISVTWSMADGDKSVGVSSPATAATDMKWSYGSNIVYHSFKEFWPETDDAGVPVEGTGKTLTLFTSKEKLSNDRSKLDNNWIEFAFTPVGGNFTPSEVTFDITKVGTGDPNIWVYFIDGEGKTITLAENAVIRKTSDPTPSETKTYTVGGAAASDKAVALRVYIGKLTPSSKQVAIGNVVIRGTLASADAPVMTIGPTELTLKSTPYHATDEATVTLAGKNLTDGTYDVTAPRVDGLSIEPTSFTVAGGEVSQVFTVSYAPTADGSGADAFGFTVGDMAVRLPVSYACRTKKYEVTPVSTAKTWNWETLTEEVLLSDATSPTNKDEFVFLELEDQIKFGDFDAASIILSNTQYPVRSKKFQNGTIKFVADVPGTIKVDFSDTGKGDGEKRFLQVEGKLTEYYTQRSESSSDRKVSGEIPVSPGVVSINAWGEESEKEVAIQVFKVTFTPAAMPTYVDVAIGEAGYATFCYAKPVDFTIAGDNIKVYSAKVNDTNATVVLKEVISKQVPANTAVVLESTSGAAKTQGQIISSAAQISDNALLVSDGTVKGDCTDDDGFKGSIFVLNKVGGEIGFYGLAKGKTLAKGKGYLKVESAGARMLALSFDGEATGIDSVTREALSNGKMYNLQGQEVRQAKGIVIMNGKKVIIK